MNMLPVLMYHGLHVDAQSRGRFDPVYSVHPDVFSRQLDWLLEHGYHTKRLDDVLSEDPEDRARRIVISFDDGDVSNIETALPLLLARDMTAEFFITTGFIDEPGMLSNRDVRALADVGMGIGSHGLSHRFLEDLDPQELDMELCESRRRLQELSLQRVDAIALPGGRGGERERTAAQTAGFRYLFGSVPGANRDPRREAWLQRLAVTRTTTPETFASLVRWQGLSPRLARLRFHALSLPKRILGNTAYERIRAKLL